jgi:hypothetical protein
MERRRTPLDRMVDLVIATPACTFDAARRLVPVVGHAVRTRLTTDPPPDHAALRPADDEPTVDGADDASTGVEEPEVLDADSVQVPALAIADYDNLAARQVVDRLDGLEPDELAAIAAHERANRHRQTILRRVEQLLP